MITLSHLQSFLDDYLHFDKNMDIAKIDPYMTNGLMVKGKDEVQKIGFGVSASLALFEKAKNAGCDALIVHHSFNLPAYNYYDSIFQNRIEFLIRNKISLSGYHFLLDAHPEVGNNIRILKVIGAKLGAPYLFMGQPWGWMGWYKNEVKLEEIVAVVNPLFSPRMITYPFGKKMIKKVVAVSGKGAPHASEMSGLMKANVDLYITGEAHEWIRELFREAGINFIAGGHYHTETFGVKALMEYVQKHCQGVQTEWIELENEI